MGWLKKKKKAFKVSPTLNMATKAGLWVGRTAELPDRIAEKTVFGRPDCTSAINYVHEIPLQSFNLINHYFT